MRQRDTKQMMTRRPNVGRDTLTACPCCDSLVTLPVTRGLDAGS